jgi:hypothetical protein
MKNQFAYFPTHWQSEFNPNSDEKVVKIIKILVLSGMTEIEAWESISEIWNEAFEQGKQDEAFNNCGEDA